MSTLSDGVFVFAIPFQSKAVSHNWQGASSQLLKTLRSCLRQTQQNVHVVLCYHDLPDNFPDATYPLGRLTLLKSPVGPPERGAPTDNLRYDKLTKIKAIAVHCGQRWSGRGHMMLLDADDLVASDLVEHVRALAPTCGLIFTNGYVAFVADRKVFMVPGPGSTEPFDQPCGSSGVLYLGKEDFPESIIDCMPGAGKQNRDRFFNRLRGHKVWRDSFEYAGRKFVVTAQRKVVYVRDHGANISALSDDGVMYLESGKKLSGSPVPLTDQQIHELDLQRIFGLETGAG